MDTCIAVTFTVYQISCVPCIRDKRKLHSRKLHGQMMFLLLTSAWCACACAEAYAYASDVFFGPAFRQPYRYLYYVFFASYSGILFPLALFNDNNNESDGVSTSNAAPSSMNRKSAILSWPTAVAMDHFFFISITTVIIMITYNISCDANDAA